MMWKIEYTKGAERDVDEIYSHIAEVLMEPDIATKQIDRILDAAEGLVCLPLRHRAYDEEPWCTRGFRFFPVGNYLIFYLADETEEVVTIFRIIHGSRDIPAQLERTEE